MRKTYIFTPLIFLCLILSMAMPAFGAAPDCKDSALFFDAEEYETILDTIENTERPATIPAATPSAVVKAYKQYSISILDLAAGLASTTDIAGLLGTDYKWIVPTEEGGYIQLAKKDGNWEVIGWQHPPTEDSIGSDVVNQDIVNQILSGFDAEITDLQCFNDAVHFTNFVFFKVNGTEYLIPFGDSSNFTGLENGKAYTRQEVQNVLPSLSGGTQNGGFGSPDSFFTIGIVALVFGIGLTVLLRVKKKTT